MGGITSESSFLTSDTGRALGPLVADLELFIVPDDLPQEVTFAPVVMGIFFFQDFTSKCP